MKKLILLSITLLFILSIIFLIIFYEEKPFIELTPENNNYVLNFTNNEDVDKIVYHTLDVVNVDSTTVIIKDITPSIKNLIEDYEVKAHIVKSGSVFTIYISNLSRGETISIISHEIAHLLQLKTGELQVIGKKVIWQKDTMDGLNYYNSPWEVNARKKENEIHKNLIKSLYK